MKPSSLQLSSPLPSPITSRASHKNLSRTKPPSKKSLRFDIKRIAIDYQFEGVEPTDSSADRGRKRSIDPLRSKPLDLSPETSTVSVRTYKSTPSPKFYRFEILERARVYIRCEYPPPDIQALLDEIFTSKISKERKLEISRIAKNTARKFSSMTQGAHREDDLVEVLYGAFDELFPKQMFNCPRKAGMLLLSDPDVYDGVLC